MESFEIDYLKGYTITPNTHQRDKSISLKAKGLLSQMFSLPDSWDYTLKGLTFLFSDGLDSVRQGIKELEEHGYVVRERKRDAKGRLGEMEYVIYETPHKAESSENVDDTPVCASPTEESPVLDFPMQEEPVQENPTQLNKNKSNKNLSITHESNPNQSISDSADTYAVAEPQPMDVMGYEEARETVKEHIEYDIMCERYPKERMDEIVDIASEALCSNRSSFTLGKDTYPYALVKDRLLRLDSSHIEYIISCINANTTEIHNIKPYLLKTLINAPATMESYYQTRVNHDLYGERRRE